MNSSMEEGITRHVMTIHGACTTHTCARAHTLPSRVLASLVLPTFSIKQPVDCLRVVVGRRVNGSEEVSVVLQQEGIEVNEHLPDSHIHLALGGRDRGTGRRGTYCLQPRCEEGTIVSIQLL